MGDEVKKPRHVQILNGGFYFRATKGMRERGISGEALGSDRRAAFARAEELNALWDGLRDSSLNPQSGTFNALIRQFERDPEWYYKNPSTRDDCDRAFRRIIEHFEEFPVAYVQRKHVRNFYNQVRVDTSIATSQKAHKYLRRLMEYAVETGLRDDNPALRMNVAHSDSREVVWHVPHLEKIIEDALEGGVAASGNLIRPGLPSPSQSLLLTTRGSVLAMSYL